MKFFASFVSWNGESIRIGNTVFTDDKFPKNIDDINELQDVIREHVGCDKIIIISFQVIDDEVSA